MAKLRSETSEEASKTAKINKTGQIAKVSRSKNDKEVGKGKNNTKVNPRNLKSKKVVSQKSDGESEETIDETTGFPVKYDTVIVRTIFCPICKVNVKCKPGQSNFRVHKSRRHRVVSTPKSTVDTVQTSNSEPDKIAEKSKPKRSFIPRLNHNPCKPVLRPNDKHMPRLIPMPNFMPQLIQEPNLTHNPTASSNSKFNSDRISTPNQGNSPSPNSSPPFSSANQHPHQTQQSPDITAGPPIQSAQIQNGALGSSIRDLTLVPTQFHEINYEQNDEVERKRAVLEKIIGSIDEIDIHNSSAKFTQTFNRYTNMFNILLGRFNADVRENKRESDDERQLSVSIDSHNLALY